MDKIIAQGAEAKIILDKNRIIKNRISKSYRIPKLDIRIRKYRTKSETKLLEKASKVINCPKPEDSKEFDKIIISYIKGQKLSENLDKLKNKISISKKIGESIAKLHNASIIHGDLTTSNIILKNNDVFFIDFGLGYISNKLEDKAVDLHLLKQALIAKHYKHWKNLWKAIEIGYTQINKKESKKVLERLSAVEKRGRYKKH